MFSIPFSSIIVINFKLSLYLVAEPLQLVMKKIFFKNFTFIVNNLSL